MNCIDAIEGTAKCILDRLQQISAKDRLDDTEHIRNVKAVIEAASFFLNKNQEVTDTPEVLQKVLYAYSKQLWMRCNETDKDQDTSPNEADEDDIEYNSYYYDYIYEYGCYPR